MIHWDSLCRSLSLERYPGLCSSQTSHRRGIGVDSILRAESSRASLANIIRVGFPDLLNVMNGGFDRGLEIFVGFRAGLTESHHWIESL